MKKVEAFVPFYDDRTLFLTARCCREAEFDRLILDISNHVGIREHLREELCQLSRNLRNGIYPSAVDAFLRAADYLREYRSVLTGAELDVEA